MCQDDLAADGDADGDGVENRDEWQTTMDEAESKSGGSQAETNRQDYAENAKDRDNPCRKKENRKAKASPRANSPHANAGTTAATQQKQRH